MLIITIWPTREEVADALGTSITSELFSDSDMGTVQFCTGMQCRKGSRAQQQEEWAVLWEPLMQHWRGRGRD